jgi:formate hydrogenlyase subunit 6/NADH:ubiquinone oxidoreductase subunit I
MKPGLMFGDIAASLFKPPVTERYPFVRRATPPRLRGLLLWDPAACTGCGLCAMDCPAQAITMHVLDKKAKRFVMEFHTDRCTFCAQCVHSCRQGCINLQAGEWELAAFDRHGYAIWYGDPADVGVVCSGAASDES